MSSDKHATPSPTNEGVELAIARHERDCPFAARLQTLEETVTSMRLQQAEVVGAAKSQARNVTIIVMIAAVFGLGLQVLGYIDRHSQRQQTALLSQPTP